MKKRITMFLFIVFLLQPYNYVRAEELPSINGQYGVSINARTGEILYDKNANEKAFPASTTKIITAILLEENVKKGEMLTASEFGSGQEASNSHFKLSPGEKISQEDAMYALLLISANDVAVTIGEHIAGSQDEFAKMMTARAKKLGALNTHFATASGLHDENHYTTPYDMALIAKEALKHPQVMEAMGTNTTTIETSMQTQEITNPSKIHDNPLVIGGKTGYTHTAGNTLVEIQEKDDKMVIAVVMKTSLAAEYDDIQVMADYAFEHIKPQVKVIEKGEIVSTVKVNGRELQLHAMDDVYMEKVKGKKKDIKTKVTEYKTKGKVIEKGQILGKLEVFSSGEKIGETSIVSSKKIVSSSEIKNQNEDESGLGIIKVLMAILIPFCLYVVFIIYYNRKRQKELLQRQKR